MSYDLKLIDNALIWLDLPVFEAQDRCDRKSKMGRTKTTVSQKKKNVILISKVGRKKILTKMEHL